MEKDNNDDNDSAGELDAGAAAAGRKKKLLIIAAAVGALVAIGLLKTFDAKFWGVVVMGGAVVILFFLPWLDNAPAKSIRYRPTWHKVLYGIFVVFFVVLGYLGIQPPSDAGTLVSQVGTLFYFGIVIVDIDRLGSAPAAPFTQSRLR